MKTILLPRLRKAPRTTLALALALTAVLAPASFAGETGKAPISGQVYPITLETALRLADERNTEIAIQLEEQKQSLLAEKAAHLEWLPTLRAGGSYANQSGALQETGGRVGDVNRDAWFGGLGVGGIGSGPPQQAGTSLEIDLAEAIFKPLAARQLTVAAEASSDATRARVLLDVAEAYYELVRTQQAINIAGDAKAEADQLAEATANFADTGEGLVADAERAAVESLLMAEAIESARGDRAHASTQLARLLRLDDVVRLEPVDGVIVPLAMVECKDGGETECLAQALSRRPELRAHTALVEAARTALKEGKYGPLIPKLQAAYSYGGFGGGGNTSNSGDRNDVGVALYWQLDGLGFLNRNEKKRSASDLRQSELRRAQMVSDIVAEVRDAHAALVSAQRRMAITQTAVTRSRKAMTLNRERIFENEGLPLESLQAMQSMARSEELNLRAVTDYNLAQLRLFVATGGDLHQPAPADGAGK